MAKIEVSWLGALPQQQDITLLDIWKMRCGRGKATLTEEEYNTLYSIDPQIALKIGINGIIPSLICVGFIMLKKKIVL